MEKIRVVKNAMRYIAVIVIVLLLHVYLDVRFEKTKKDENVSTNVYLFDVKKENISLVSGRSAVEAAATEKPNFDLIFQQRRSHISAVCRAHKINVTEFEKFQLNEKVLRTHSGFEKKPVSVMRYFLRDSAWKESEHYLANDSRLNQKVQLRSNLLDRERRLLYCWNYKAASSSWLSLFSSLAPAGKQDSPRWTIQNKLAPKSLYSFHAAVAGYINIILVRHPFIRLGEHSNITILFISFY